MRHLLATPRALLVLPKNGQGWRRRVWATAVLTAVALARVCLLLAVLTVPPVAAVEPDEMLADPALEARARLISQELRCLVCQNQSIDDSNAALAKDLRLIVRERLRAGDSNAAVLAFVEARYGEFVLLRPKLNAHTLLLWLAPLLLLAATAVGVIRRTRASRTAPAKAAAQPLSTAEQQRLAELLQRERDPSA
jgi:cytochrome c-type biogenesis protein CcmH